jgi:hypothetical protein
VPERENPFRRREVNEASGTVTANRRYKTLTLRKTASRFVGRDAKDDAMSRLASFGFWTCAAVYAAIGVIGVFLIGAQPNIAGATEGYGTIRLLAQK